MQRSIVIKQEYARLVPQASESSYQELKQAIKEEGFDAQYPIVVNQDGVLLDGHHRYRICQELGIEPTIAVKTFADPLLEKKFVIERNLKRRHLNDFQKGELALLLKPILAEIAKQRQGTRTDILKTSGKLLPEVKSTRDTLADKAGISNAQLTKIEKIKEKASPETIEKVRQGRQSINKAYNKVKREERKEQIINAEPVLKLPEAIQIHNGDFREVCKDIPPNSIDLIFTDPPYANEFVPLYEDLGKLASRVLKDGGSLVTYLGQHTIPEVLRFMEQAGLKYWWILAVKHTGASASVYGRQVFVGWKPLLWFVKGNKLQTGEFMSDYIESKPPEKALHEWEQSTVEAEHVIHQLTYENGIVLDPFMGSGTTGAGALKLKRQFIGCEIDTEKFNTARARLGAIREA